MPLALARPVKEPPAKLKFARDLKDSGACDSAGDRTGQLLNGVQCQQTIRSQSAGRLTSRAARAILGADPADLPARASRSSSFPRLSRHPQFPCQKLEHLHAQGHRA